MSASFLRRQRGAVLILLLAVLVIGASWFLVRRLDAVAGDFTAVNRAYNAAVLNRAKQALIGYVAAQADKQFENNPGALPCPEAPAYFNSATGNDGKVASSCTLPVVGRFPWRTIGTDKLIDAAGEPLWYVVSPGWSYTGWNTTINSNSVGQLTVDGVAGTDNDTVVALLIAPGPPINVTASTGCTAWAQSRPTSGTPDWRNYLECENATSPADSVFVTTGPSGSFNDQVVRITKADIMPGIEAAIANRIEREIVPVLKTIYAAPGWGLTGSNVIYPFAAPFTDPSTSGMQGAPATYGGLLPLSYSETSPGSGTACTGGVGAPQCSPSFVAWSSASMSGGSIYSPSCTTTATQISCTFYYWCFLSGCGPSSLPFTLNATASNVGMVMRQLNVNAAMTNVDASGRSASGIMNSNGSSAVTLNGSTTVPGSGSFFSNALCGISGFLSFFFGCKQYTILVPITLLADHPILDPSNATYGWFLRNKWHELTYYAIATNYSPVVMPAQPSCTTGTSCLSVSNVTPAAAQRAILILAGRSINGSERPSDTLANYLEFGNATGAFERQRVSTAVAALLKKPFNDRIVVVDTN
jgi:hypothetical protein